MGRFVFLTDRRSVRFRFIYLFYNSIVKLRCHNLKSCIHSSPHFRPGLKEIAVYMLTASNVVLDILYNDLLLVDRIIQNMRKFKKRKRILNRNRNIDLNNRNSIIFLNRSALLSAGSQTPSPQDYPACIHRRTATPTAHACIRTRLSD